MTAILLQVCEVITSDTEAAFSKHGAWVWKEINVSAANVIVNTLSSSATVIITSHVFILSDNARTNKSNSWMSLHVLVLLTETRMFFFSCCFHSVQQTSANITKSVLTNPALLLPLLSHGFELFLRILLSFPLHFLFYCFLLHHWEVLIKYERTLKTT